METCSAIMIKNLENVHDEGDLGIYWEDWFLIFGEEATLIGIDMNEGSGAVLGVIQKNKKKVRVPIQDIKIKDKTTKSLEWIEAYRYYIGVIR